MITYNAKDLIQQATMLADLQNSDFISWKENIMFLDNAWTELYQSLINHGDKTYLQEFSFSGERTYLPDDFYQLYYVCYTNGTYEKPIARKAKTSTGQGPYYDIVGNELIIYRDSVSNMNKIKVQYYPTKAAITLRNKTVKIDPSIVSGAISRYPYNQLSNIVDASGDYLLYTFSYSSNNSLKYGYIVFDAMKGLIKEIVDNISYSVDLPTSLNIVSGEPQAATILGRGAGSFKLKINNIVYPTDFSSGTVITFNIYKGSYSSGICKRYVISRETDLLLSNTMSNSTYTTLLNDDLYGFRYIDGQNTVGNGLYKVNLPTGELSLVDADAIPGAVVSFNGNIYYNTSNGVCRNGEVILDSPAYMNFTAVADENLNTGYGILADNAYHGIFEDTELDFPNNFFYNFLAYKLAIYYKIKQNADPSGLMVMLSEAEKTFYDTLPRDENNFVRIANAYAY